MHVWRRQTLRHGPARRTSVGFSGSEHIYSHFSFLLYPVEVGGQCLDFINRTSANGADGGPVSMSCSCHVCQIKDRKYCRSKMHGSVDRTRLPNFLTTDERLMIPCFCRHSHTIAPRQSENHQTYNITTCIKNKTLCCYNYTLVQYAVLYECIKVNFSKCETW